MLYSWVGKDLMSTYNNTNLKTEEINFSCLYRIVQVQIIIFKTTHKKYLFPSQYVYCICIIISTSFK